MDIMKQRLNNLQKKVVTILGARPQFIKAAAVSRVIRQSEGLHEVLVHTGQHYDTGMSAVFFRELEIPKSAYNLGIGSGNHGAQTGRMLEAIEEVLLKEQPDWVLVYGDTNSTLAGALAASKLHIPLAHVEAGLRSFNRSMPEEINRVLTDHVADMLFAPTKAAVQNLRREGIREEHTRLVGDVMYDAALYYSEKAERESCILERLGLKSGDYILATVHRAENTDDPARLKTIVEGLALVAREIPVVLPLHPRTKKALEQHSLVDRARPLRSIDPVGYLDMVMLERNARLIVTDSGGVQKEAFFSRVPCVTLREETEWAELVELGWNRLCPPSTPEAVSRCLWEEMESRGDAAAPYGDGEAAKRIVRVLRQGVECVSYF